jgi:pimeloyl-ACP methyl ester carboxylesterase
MEGTILWGGNQMGRAIELLSCPLSNGETLGYRVAGEGDQNLLLIHGNMTSSKHWQPVLESMPEGYRMVAVDLRGFGISSYKRPISSLREFADDVKELVDALGFKDFTIAGWSTGGGVAMEFVANYPGYAKKMILLESVGYTGYPIYRKDENGQPIMGDLLKTKEEIAADPIQVVPILHAYATRNKEILRSIWDAAIYNRNKPDESTYEEYLDDMLTQRNLVDVDYALASFNMSHQHNGVSEGSGLIDQIDIPTLVLWGKQDLVVPEYMATTTAEAIGENAKLMVIDHWGHSPIVDDLEGMIRIWDQFIKE